MELDWSDCVGLLSFHRVWLTCYVGPIFALFWWYFFLQRWKVQLCSVVYRGRVCWMKWILNHILIQLDSYHLFAIRCLLSLLNNQTSCFGSLCRFTSGQNCFYVFSELPDLAVPMRIPLFTPVHLLSWVYFCSFLWHTANTIQLKYNTAR